VLHLGYYNPYYNYDLNGATLETVTEEKDLGVWITNTLSVSKQCDTAAAGAFKLIGLLSRHLPRLDNRSFRTIYKSLILPRIEYANMAWLPWLQNDVDLLERVQHRATKQLSKVPYLDYTDRCKQISILPLVERRRRGALIETYKLMTGKVGVSWDNFFELNNRRDTKGHIYKLIKPFCRLDIRMNFFSPVVVNDWNALSKDVVISTSTNQFKNKLDKNIFKI